MSDESAGLFPMWGILELMGHRRLAGRMSEESVGGASMIRIDIPRKDGWTTQLYSGSAVYCITPTSEETAREVADLSRPAPVQPWELPRLGGPEIEDVNEV